jgi:hypothetical protein
MGRSTCCWERSEAVTEDEWFACTAPSQLFAFLDRKGTFRWPLPEEVSRRLRLFACACLYPIRVHGHAIFKTAIETAERFADGMASSEELKAARRAAAFLADPEGEQTYADRPWMQPDVVSEVLASVAGLDMQHTVITLVKHGVKLLSVDWEREGIDAAAFPRFLCQLFRCIFGNPFHPAAADPSWFRWNDGAIPKVAQAIYDARHFEDVPILADALEEAGCTSAHLLSHLREPGPHARGCWALDLVLANR